MLEMQNSTVEVNQQHQAEVEHLIHRHHVHLVKMLLSIIMTSQSKLQKDTKKPTQT